MIHRKVANIKISGGLMGVLAGLQPGAPTFMGCSIPKSEKSVICEQYTIRCKRNHRQLELITRRYVLIH